MIFCFCLVIHSVTSLLINSMKVSDLSKVSFVIVGLELVIVSRSYKARSGDIWLKLLWRLASSVFEVTILFLVH